MNETIGFLELQPGEAELGRVKGACWAMPGRSGRKLPGEIIVTDRRILFQGREGNVAAWRPAFSLPYGEIVDAEKCTVGFLSPTGLRLFVKGGGSYRISVSQGRNALLSMLDKRLPARRPGRKPQPGELPRLLVCAALAVFLLYISAGDTLASFRASRDFVDLLDGTVAVGDRVQGEIILAFDYIATEQTYTERSDGSRSAKKTSAYYYLVPAGEGYAVVDISAAKGRDMARLAEETLAFLNGGDAPQSTVSFDGRVKLLEKEEPELVSYYEETLEEYGYTQAEIRELGAPMLLIPRAYGAIRAFAGVGVLFLAVSLFLAGKTFRPARTRKGGAANPEAPWEV